MGMAPDDLTGVHLGLIETADLLVGGRRHIAPFKENVPATFDVSADLKGLLAVIENHRREGKRVVVLASGDPLYYGIGSYLARNLGAENVRIYPNITAVAAAFARLGEPWQDVPVVSLHGRRQEDRLLQAVRRSDRIAVFTDPTCSPQWVAAFLRRRQIRGFEIGVFECMGSADEQVSWHRPQSIAKRPFRSPNMVVLKKTEKTRGEAATLYLGMPETAYDHEQGLITKAEIRAVSLARLQLMPGQVFWDLGAGSGAVAIEASLLNPGGRIVAVEKNPARIAQIRANRDRYGVVNMDVVEADLPRGLSSLPDPDRVFIGGGGQALDEMVAVVCRRLTVRGVVVINTVLVDSLHKTLHNLRKKGLQSDVVQIQASRSQPLAGSERMQAMNPVWIIRGVKPGSGGR
jgi:precorrin-6Y C5,15-methyltransferase (decarboxylating)